MANFYGKLLIYVLREAGFTGTITDRLGRKVHFANGRRVKGTVAPKATAGGMKKAAASSDFTGWRKGPSGRKEFYLKGQRVKSRKLGRREIRAIKQARNEAKAMSLAAKMGVGSQKLSRAELAAIRRAWDDNRKEAKAMRSVANR